MQVLSTHQFEREIQEGAECFLLLAYSIVTDKVQKEMFVVQELWMYFLMRFLDFHLKER